MERLLFLWLLLLIAGHYVLGLSVSKVCGTSMASTFDDGEYVLVAAVRDCQELQRGDVITFHPTSDRRTTYVKRVVGLPGDVIEAQNDLLFVNGKSNGVSQIGTGTWGPITIDDDCIFALGDNRAVSIDSRTLGCIPFQQVCAKAIWQNGLLS